MRRVLAVVAVLLVVLAGVLAGRALTLPSLQPEAEPLEPLRLDEAGAVARLAGAVRFPTVSWEDRDRTDTAAFRAFHAYLEASFPQVHQALRVDTVGDLSLLYTWGGEDGDLPPVVLMAHQDVVPAEGAGWTHPPFAGVVEGGWVWGRGTMDDKGSLVAILEAVETLLDAGFRPLRTVHLAFGHDEEVGGVRGAAAVARTLAARGVDEYALVLDEGGAVVRGMVPGMDGSAALVGVAEKGYLNVELVVEGAGGHSSTPPRETAVGILARALARLEGDPFPARLAGPSEAMFRWLAPEMPLGPRTLFANLWLTRPLVEWMLASEPATAAAVRTTTAPTMLEGSEKPNVLPLRARAVVNHRILPGETRASVVERVRAVVDDPRVAVRPVEEGSSDPSPVSGVDGRAFRTLGRTIREVLGPEEAVVAPFLLMAGTDAKHFAALSDRVYRFLPAPVGPEDLARMHGVDERLSAESHLTAVRFYHRLLENAAGG